MFREFDSPNKHIFRPFQIYVWPIFKKAVTSKGNASPACQRPMRCSSSLGHKYGILIWGYQVISALSASLRKPCAAPLLFRFHRHWKHPGWPGRSPVQSNGRVSVLQLFSLLLKHFPDPGGQPHYIYVWIANFAPNNTDGQNSCCTRHNLESPLVEVVIQQAASWILILDDKDSISLC